ncbi:MAG TPA: hypothetical protein PK777_14660, partial [Thermoguttaceae bacterium]|nr:hypothetical protein [Thermoguttaceae bacterium]
MPAMSAGTLSGRSACVSSMCGAGSRRQGGGGSLPFCRRLPRSLDGVTALGWYESPLREVILRMKQRRHTPLSQAI